MRPRVLLAVVTLAFTCGVGLLLLRQEKQMPPADSSAPASQALTEDSVEKMDPTTSPSEKSREIKSSPPSARGPGTDSAGEPNSKPRTAKGQVQEERHRADVENRTSELMELAMNDDTNSLHTILSELNNPDPEIRQAALDAAIQFGSTNAIPALESASLWNDNPEEKKQIAEAIEFLKLPQLGDPNFPITGSSKGPVRKPLANRNPSGVVK